MKGGEEASEFEPEWLEEKIEEGVNSGSPIPIDEKFWDDLRREVHKRSGRQKKNIARDNPEAADWVLKAAERTFQAITQNPEIGSQRSFRRQIKSLSCASFMG